MRGAILLLLAGVANAADNPWSEATYVLGGPAFVTGKMMTTMDRGDLGYYAMGVHDSLKSRNRFCTPDEIRSGALADALVAYVRARPESEQDEGQLVALRAFAQFWPCPKR